MKRNKQMKKNEQPNEQITILDGKEDPTTEQSNGDSLEAQLASKEEETRLLIERLQRLQAEFENYKKRVSREATQLEERASDREILDFIPLYDNLQRAFASYSNETDAAAFVRGIEKIFAQFDQVLKAKGVIPFDAVGTMFDPAKHEALLSVESGEEKNTVLEEFERGYERNGRVLRPCKVKVSNGKMNAEQKEEL